MILWDIENLGEGIMNRRNFIGKAGLGMAGLAASGLVDAAVGRPNNENLRVKRILSPELSGSKCSIIDEAVLSAGCSVPLSEHPEERLYYFLSGRGLMSIYEEAPQGDVYEIRQDTAVWLTPKVKHQIINTAPYPLRFAVLMAEGGVAPEGALSWSAVTQRGVEVKNPQIGAGQMTTYVFDEGSNPSKAEGLHLRIRDILLRRPQKFSNAEVLTIAPGRSTRPHTHHDSEENVYVLVGNGEFIWNDKAIPCEAGSCLSYPVGVVRCVRNNGDYPLSYICYSVFTA